MKRNFFGLFLIIAISFFFVPTTVSAITCSYCGHYQSSPLPCNECGRGSYMPRRPIGPLKIDNNIVKPRPPKPIPIRGRGKGALGALIIALGTFIFFEQPVIGIIVIIIGLVIMYSFFRDQKENKTAEITSTDSSASLVSSDSGENSPQKNSNRPSRGSDTEKTNTIAISSKPQLSENSKNAPSLEEKTKSNPANSSAHWFIEGVNYCTGKDGRTVNYQLAEDCFQKAKALGDKDAESWLEYLQNIVKT